MPRGRSGAEHLPVVADLADYVWLTGDQAARWIELAGLDMPITPATLRRFRRDLSSSRAGLVVEQAELRRRAAVKFAAAEQMFFTRRSLEQATDEIVARYKAARFGDAGVLDLCCGIGGDLMALAVRGQTIGIDNDRLIAVLARANTRGLLGEARAAQIVCTPASQHLLAATDCWHIDPDRRPAGRRTSRVENSTPSVDLLEQWLRDRPDAAVKLAPAAKIPDTWRLTAEWEWISRAGECRQLMAWFGRLSRAPGEHRATLLPSGRTVAGRPTDVCSRTDGVGRFVFEPDAAVLASGLTGTLANQHALEALGPQGGYLTGNQSVEDPALAAFEVECVLPLDMKQVNAALRSAKVGRIEVKKRGVDHDPARVAKELRLAGDREATLILARVAGRPRAIIAQRVAAGRSLSADSTSR